MRRPPFFHVGLAPRSMRLAGLCACVPAAYVLAALGGSSGADPGDERAGGATTVHVANSHAFSLPAPNLDPEALARHIEGDRLFDAAFVTAPAPVQGGLGPVFNRNACVACHPRDGRSDRSLLLRVSAPGAGPHGGPRPVPGFGTQIQDRAVFGHAPEARVETGYSERVERLAGGTTVTLRVPRYRLDAPYRPLPPGVLVSPRMARPVFGLGLLEAVPEATLYRLAAAQAAAGEVSGRVNRVWDPSERRMRAGRFGHKAGRPSLRVQTAAALRDDVGVTNAVFADESDADEPDGAAPRGVPELATAELDALTFYVQTLAVPARRRMDDAAVQHGERLFASVGCASCHVPRLETGVLAGVPAVSGQTAFPYSDLLLHDMGAGLADGRPEYGASGREWRTPPLWGIGLTEVVNGRPGFLHDGRARTLAEAVLWHGGEAEASRERFRRLAPAERDALLSFLRSL